MSVDLYQSDVREMSDEELKVLGDELRDEYYVSYTLPCECCTDSEWTDEAAGARYDAMQAEIRRRWDLAHPQEVARRRAMAVLSPGVLTKLMLDSLQRDLVIASLFDGIGSRFTK